MEMPQITQNYRPGPIAVGEPTMWLYAAIIVKRQVDFTESRGKQLPTQAGVRPGMSCEHQTLLLQHSIDQEVQKKKGRLHYRFVLAPCCGSSKPVRQQLYYD